MNAVPPCLPAQQVISWHGGSLLSALSASAPYHSSVPTALMRPPVRHLGAGGWVSLLGTGPNMVAWQHEACTAVLSLPALLGRWSSSNCDAVEEFGQHADY